MSDNQSVPTITRHVDPRIVCQVSNTTLNSFIGELQLASHKSKKMEEAFKMIDLYDSEQNYVVFDGSGKVKDVFYPEEVDTYKQTAKEKHDFIESLPISVLSRELLAIKNLLSQVFLNLHNGVYSEFDDF